MSITYPPFNIYRYELYSNEPGINKKADRENSGSAYTFDLFDLDYYFAKGALNAFRSQTTRPLRKVNSASSFCFPLKAIPLASMYPKSPSRSLNTAISASQAAQFGTLNYFCRIPG